MTTSITQIKANQSNAQKSTGPLTEDGKKVVAGNAVKHGIFSKQLILSDENPSDYLALLEGLQVELRPVGILEQSLVERIAITLWRQKRLVRSETAHIELERRPSDIVSDVNKAMNYGFMSDDLIKEDDIKEFDQEQYHWCQSVIQEYEKIEPAKLIDIKALKREAPLIHRQLSEEAETDQQTMAEYLNEWEQPLDYFVDLIKYCQAQIQKAEQRPLILELAALVQSKKAILQGKLRDTLSKYQVMLDNELYKAIKALREAQNWRMETLDSVSEENGFVLENAKN